MSLHIRLQFLPNGIFAHIVDDTTRTLCGQDAQGYAVPIDTAAKRPEEPIPCGLCQKIFDREVLGRMPRTDSDIATGEVAQGIQDVFLPPVMYVESLATIPPEFGTQRTDADRLRDWMGALDLSDVEAARALNLGNPGVAIREYKRGKPIGGPATRLMAVTTALVIAIADLRKGQPGKARDRLERLLTPALASAVDKIAPPATGAQGG